FPYLIAGYILKIILRKLYCCIVYQGCYSSQLFCCFGNGIFAKLLIFYISAYKQAFSSFFFNQLFSAFGIFMLVIIYYGYIRTLAGKMHRCAAPYAAVSSRNERNLSFKLIAALVAFSYNLGLRPHFMLITRLALRLFWK